MHSAASTYVRIRSTWEPDPERTALYDELYAAYLGRREAARSLGWAPPSGDAPSPPAVSAPVRAVSAAGTPSDAPKATHV